MKFIGNKKVEVPLLIIFSTALLFWVWYDDEFKMWLYPSPANVIRGCAWNRDYVGLDRRIEKWSTKEVKEILQSGLLQSQNDDICNMTVYVLTCFHEPSALPELMKLLSRRDIYSIRLGNALSKGGIDLEQVKPLLQNADPVIRERGCWTLFFMKSPQRTSLLIPLLDDNNNLVKSTAISALKRTNDESAIEPLIKFLKKEDDQHLKYLCARTLGDLKSTKALGALFEEILNPANSWYLKDVCFKAIENINDLNSIDRLEELSQSSNGDISRNAKMTIKAIHNKKH